MDGDQRGSNWFRLRLSTLLLLVPLLAVTAALAGWVSDLRQQVTALEQRVSALEPSAGGGGNFRQTSKGVAVPFEIDRAMLMDRMQPVSTRQRY